MTPLAHDIDNYMALRRSLGFKLSSEHRLLIDFAAFMDAAGASTVTIELALRWATTPTGVGHAYLAQRMRAVRGFARYLHGIDPATEIPPLELLPARRHRPTPPDAAHLQRDRDRRADGRRADAAADRERVAQVVCPRPAARR
jgi:integrase/recombinase XerD